MKQPIKMTPGDDLHLTMLMAPYSLNLVTGQVRQHLLGYGRAAFEAGKASQCLLQIQEPEAETWPCVNIDVNESGEITNAKLYSPGLPAGNHDVYPVRVPYMDEHTEAWRACVDELEKAVPGFMSMSNMNGIECAVAAIKSLGAQKAAANTLQQTLDETALLVRKLVQQLRKAAPDNDSAEKALDYLKRKGLAGTFLRGNGAFVPDDVPTGVKPSMASDAVGTSGSTCRSESVPALQEALREAKYAITSMKTEAETAAQGDEQMMLEACEQISKEGLEASLAIDAVLGTWDRHEH